MSRTCKSIRALHVAALAGICIAAPAAMAQSSKLAAPKVKVAPPVAAPAPIQKAHTAIEQPTQVDHGVAGAPSGGQRGPGGACVLPGGAGCITVGSAQECTDQFGTFQGVGSACPVGLCEGVNSCQTFQYPRVAGTSFASMGAPNANINTVAEDFRTANGTHSLTSVCWWGTYGALAGQPAINCANLAPDVDHFFVRIYEMTAGLPDVSQVVAEFEQGVSMSVARRNFCDGGNLLTYEFRATLNTPLALQANHCYALEVRNPNNNTVNWFWSRSSVTANNQCWQRSGETPYVSAGVQTGDRAFCMNVNLDIFQATCAVPPPPICENPDSNGYARLGANTGLFSADPSAPGVGLQLANSLQFATSAPISNVCFWGFWVAPDNTQPPGPDTPDFWFTIYDSNGPDGLPGTEVLRGRCGTDVGFVSRRNGGNYNIEFPEFSPIPNHCYYFSISFPQDNSDPAHAFRFGWGAALTSANPLSNFYTASRAANPPGAWAFQNFGDPTIAETTMVFDQPGVLPSCGAPPPPPEPPVNDSCQTPSAIAGEGTFNYDNRGATCDSTERAAGCGTSSNSIWYTWTPACDGTYTISMCAGSTDDNVLSAYDGTDCFASTELACGDDTCNIGGGPSTITFPASGGTTYLVRVATWSATECVGATGAAGTFTIARDEGKCGGGNPCPCDWNDNGALNSQDFFDFLTDFFAGNADYNNSGQTNSQDFFDFLTCFFEPPSTCF